MTLTSIQFPLFCLLLTVLYFLVPGSWQWILLLGFSLYFYTRSGYLALVFLLTAALAAFLTGLWMERELDRSKKQLAGCKDRSQKANEFMRLNLILNNLVHSLPNVVHDDTLKYPRHFGQGGKGIKQFDYIVSNPPFKADFSDTRDDLAGDKYRKRFWAGVPNITNDPDKMEIYLMFLQHIVASMDAKGHAAMVVPTGFLTAKGKIPMKIRKKMVESKMLRGVVSMPSNIFANTGTNVSIVFLDASVEHDHALLMDASKLGEKRKVDGKNQRTFLSADEIERIVQTFNADEGSSTGADS